MRIDYGDKGPYMINLKDRICGGEDVLKMNLLQIVWEKGTMERLGIYGYPTHPSNQIGPTSHGK